MNKVAQIVSKDGVDWVRQPINFTPDIMSEYYVGENFLDLNINEELKSGSLHARVERAGIDGFMPKLVDELKWIIGEGNHRYGGYEFGKDEICFYFMIRKDEYNQIMNKIKYWAIVKDFDEMISYHLKKVQQVA
jgi:hypothetical protein